MSDDTDAYAQHPAPLVQRWGVRFDVAGRPASDNRAKQKIVVFSVKKGREIPMNVDTPQAKAWMAAVAQATLVAIAQRGRGVPHPERWPRPLRLTMTLRDGRLDVTNVLKTTLDALKGPLGVDDKFFELGALTRAPITRTAPRGMTIVVESAPLPSAALFVCAVADTVAETTTPAPRVKTSRTKRARKTTPAVPVVAS